MGYDERKQLYRKCEELRGNPLISYVTSIRPNLTSQMAGDAIPCIIEQVNRIPDEQKAIDFLIISNGGDPITSLRIISILRERFDKITVLIPYVAYSAATILALGADNIIMHPFSNLGPVDPQITVAKQNVAGQQSHLQFGSEDVRNYIDFVKTDVGILEQEYLVSAFNSLATEIGPLNIGSAKRSQQLSLALSTKMLETHMDNKDEADAIAKALNSSYYHHGYAVGRSEARKIGLKIEDPSPELETAIWAIWEDYCTEMNCFSEFNYINEIMSDPSARSKIASVPVISLPANAPPDVAQSLIIQWVQQNMQVTQQEPIERSYLFAAIESDRTAFAVNLTLSILYWRDVNMELAFNITSYSSGWESL
jgi:hypothetical protein